MSKRLALGIAAASVASFLVGGASFALFSATSAPAEKVFTAGSVKVGEPLEFKCDINPEFVAPGFDDVCKIKIDYTGSLDAWLGFTAVGEGDLFSGSTPMVISSSHSPKVGDYWVLGEMKGKKGKKTATAYVSYTLPRNANNDYQEKAGTIKVTFHAVQSYQNTNAQGNGPVTWE